MSGDAIAPFCQATGPFEQCSLQVTRSSVARLRFREQGMEEGLNLGSTRFELWGRISRTWIQPSFNPGSIQIRASTQVQVQPRFNQVLITKPSTSTTTTTTRTTTTPKTQVQKHAEATQTMRRQTTQVQNNVLSTKSQSMHIDGALKALESELAVAETLTGL